MGNVIQEMLCHVPECFMRHHIFLAAILTIFTLYNCTAIQTILFFSLWYMRHYKFFLKISTKNTRLLSFSLLNNSSTFDVQNNITRYEKHYPFPLFSDFHKPPGTVLFQRHHRYRGSQPADANLQSQ